MGEQRNSGSRGRTEPSLGDLDQLHGRPAAAPSASPPSAQPDMVLPGETRRRASAPPPPSPRRGGSRRGWLWPVLAVIVIAVGTLAWLNQDALRGLFPRTQLNSLLARADAAYAAGNLEGNDGNSARELYGAVRALEPDNEQANAGLRKVGEAELQRARDAIAKGDYADAQAAVEDARELLGGGDDVHDVSQQLLKARQSQAQTDALITQAQSALAAGKLDGDQGAAKLFQQALKADPDNAVARHGLDKVGDALAGQARAALDAGQLDQADNLIGDIASLMPGYGDLPSLRAHLAQARQQSEAAIQQHLQQASDALRAGKFTGDGDDNALAQFQAVLKLDPDNAQAKAGVGQVAQALILRANASIDAQDFKDASTLLDQAQQLAPHSSDLAAARSRLSSQQQAAGQDQPATPLSPQQQARVDDLLKRAQAALDAGDIMLPPGASAYDLYSEVLNIDGNNRDALAGLQGLAGHARIRFDRAMSKGDLAQASKMLSVLEQLVPGDTSQVGMRRRLASAWLDQAEKRLDEGNRAAAQQALQAAGKLRPDAPRLQALRTRLGNG
ncbi:hypothetical protein [Oleiagrimonas soli]|uniref:Tetratricopeptide (TPR) repeat protein n=1 Tax=Oleiagrimonas soli TaxID=1543381 RepID=A0A099CUG5_9GAMM|nr:hypothetical protein [Oleiagrimonas soli]KGI77272.1 hypothetical protein LF63_0111865 [Oleiagrimonas soli]MBB6185527.1 tetratricopeptide (TPR) repeat protein [Oleiagrimonas soli]